MLPQGKVQPHCDTEISITEYLMTLKVPLFDFMNKRLKLFFSNFSEIVGNKASDIPKHFSIEPEPFHTT